MTRVVWTDRDAAVAAKLWVGLLHLLTLVLPYVDISNFEFMLHVTADNVVDSCTQNAWTACEQCIYCVGYRENRVGAEHIVIIDGSETIANVVDHNFNGASEEWMPWG